MTHTTLTHMQKTISAWADTSYAFSALVLERINGRLTRAYAMLACGKAWSMSQDASLDMHRNSCIIELNRCIVELVWNKAQRS